MALFACSFDAASPLAPWTTATGVSIVAGRDANGCSLPNTSAFLTLASGLGASVAVGLAFKPEALTNSVCKISDTSGFAGCAFVSVDNSGDGRIYLTIGGTSVGSAQTLVDGFIQSIGIWNYYEVVASISQVVTPVDATHSNVLVTVVADLYINDGLVGSATRSWTLTNILNVNIPAGTFGEFTIRQNTSIVDDVYANPTRIGDCFVQSDDTTVTVEPSAPDLTQTLFEVGLIDPTAAPDVTQALYEVGIALITTLSLACPVGGGTAQIGVFYDQFLVAAGGTPPYTFEIIP